MTDRELMQQALEKLDFFAHMKSVSEDTIRLIADLRERLAHPEQEPVAWGVFDGPNLHDVNFTEEEAHEMVRLKGDGSVVKPLYTAPPQRKPLTEEEIRDLWSWAMTAEAERTATTQQHAFARAIERAHGIGGSDVGT